MRHLIFGLLAWAAFSAAAAAHNLPPCYDPETAVLRQISSDDLASHGGTALGPVDYPAGTLHRNFEFFVSYVIDTDGHVSCISATERVFMSPQVLDAEVTPQRRALLDALAVSTFVPFTDADGRPEKVLVQTGIDEEELPARHVPQPQGDLASAVIQLQSSGHRSPEHGYTIVVNGNGEASFTDKGLRRTYRLPQVRITDMLDLAAAADFWSLKDVYAPPFNPKTPWAYAEKGGYYRRVTITLGTTTKTVTIYDWGTPGAPIAARDLMTRMASLGGLDLFRYWGTTPDTIALEIYNGFDFSSPKGGDMLVSAAANSLFSDSDIYGLIAKGAPLDHVVRGDLDTDLLDAAIVGNRWEMADNLVEQGALLTNDRPDEAKATRALAHAAAEASAAWVRRLLTYRPRLTIEHDVYDLNGVTRKVDPIITYVGRYLEPWREDYHEPTDDLIAVTQSLVAAGADINGRDSEGDNILIHALENSQLEFGRWLIARGVSPRRPDGSWPYFEAAPPSEDVTMILLDLGAADDPDALAYIVSDAQSGDEPKVEAWLKTHGKWHGD